MARLTYEKVKQLVWDNNGYTIDDKIIIAQAYKESRFDPSAKSKSSTATGLMQMTKTAVTEVNRVRKTSYKHEDMTIPETNIECASVYLEILLKRNKDDIAKALDKYGTGPGYSTNILKARDDLANSTSPTNTMNILIKAIGP